MISIAMTAVSKPILLIIALFAGILPLTAQSRPVNCKDEIANIGTAGNVQIDRFMSLISSIEQLAKNSKSLEDIINEVVTHDGRGFVFRLEGLFRLYSVVYGAKINDWEGLTKDLEDAIGHYTEQIEFKQFYETRLKDKKGLPHEGMIKYYDSQITSHHQELMTLLENYHWDPSASKKENHSFLEKMKSFIQKTKWKDPQEEQNLIFETIKSEIKKIEKGVAFEKLNNINKLKQNREKLVYWLHELRRLLRWILIYIQSFPGYFELDPPKKGDPLPEYVYLTQTPLANSRFSKVQPDNRITRKIHIHFHLFLAISQFVQDLGEVKSYGEGLNAASHALVAAGGAKDFDQAFDKIRDLLKDDPDYIRVAHRGDLLVDELENSNLLKVFRKSMRIQ